MAYLKNYDLKKKKNYIYIFKIVTVTLLIWIYNPYHYNVSQKSYRTAVDCDGSLVKRTKIDKILVVYFQRSLAKHDYKKNIDSSMIKERLPDYRINMEIKNKSYMSTYGNLNKEGLNELDAYRKGYKNRYSKKNGLAKLDCYCEKKVFDIIDYIYDLAKRMRNDKKTYKKHIYRKFAIRIFIIALLPLLGIIIPILFGGRDPEKRIVPWTIYDCRNKTNEGYCRRGFIHFKKGQMTAIAYLNYIFFLALSIIVLLTVIYIFIKTIKYERLKLGKGEMNRKEYINFCKNVFKNKIYV